MGNLIYKRRLLQCDISNLLSRKPADTQVINCNSQNDSK